jgi:hopanoid C-3 methylase
MKILLVRPRSSPETIGLQHVMLVEPLELEVLAALAREQDTVTIVDLVLEEEPFEDIVRRLAPDLLGVTGYITNVPEMIRLCAEAKRLRPGIVTVVGGVHCEVCPADLDDPAVDFRVVRNATATFPALLRHVAGEADLPPGVVRPGERVDPRALPALDFTYPRPARELTRKYRSRYFYIFHDKVALLKTAFGCPFRCNFCFCRKITSGRYHERPVAEVLDELSSIEEREIYIVDDDFLVSRKRVTDFLDGLEARKIHKHYLLYGRADFIAEHPDLVERFRALGLRTVIVGLESFFADELEQYQKGITPDTNEQAMRILRRLGVDCFATLILSPTWGREQFAACGRKLRELGIHYVNLQPLTPLPGTDFEVPPDQQLLRREDFEKWDLAHLAVRPTQLSIPEYYAEIIKLYQQVLFVPANLWRYARQYSLRMMWKMAVGTARVRRQYEAKMAEAKDA